MNTTMKERRKSILESLKGLEKDVKHVQACLDASELTASVAKGKKISEELRNLLEAYIPYMESEMDSNEPVDESKTQDFEKKCFELCQTYVTAKMELYKSNHLT